MWLACARLLTEAGVKALRLDWAATRGSAWIASVWDEVGNRVHANGLGPAMALAAVTERIASARRCECGRPIVLSDKAVFNGAGGCRWTLQGARFAPVDHPLKDTP
jgi:hypothetical protein